MPAFLSLHCTWAFSLATRSYLVRETRTIELQFTEISRYAIYYYGRLDDWLAAPLGGDTRRRARLDVY